MDYSYLKALAKAVRNQVRGLKSEIERLQEAPATDIIKATEAASRKPYGFGLDPTHRVVSATRHTLSAAGNLLRDAGQSAEADDVSLIGHVLPYLWSGGNGVADEMATRQNKEAISALLMRYGLRLPASPDDAVPMLVLLATHLISHSNTLLLVNLQRTYGSDSRPAP